MSGEGLGENPISAPQHALTKRAARGLIGTSRPAFAALPIGLLSFLGFTGCAEGTRIITGAPKGIERADHLVPAQLLERTGLEGGIDECQQNLKSCGR